MALTVQLRHVATQFGRLAVRTVGEGSRPPLFCIHGNSGCSKIFRPIFESSIPSTRQVLAVDLPGHGESEDAKDAESTYTMPAYAKACVEVLKSFGHREAVMIGWSLGGHVATEMLPILPGAKGLALVSSFLLPRFAHGPPQDDRTKWNMRTDLTEEDLTQFSKRGTGGPWEEWMAKAAIRTDPKARQTLFANLGFGDCSDQRQLIADTSVPTALIVGTKEPVHDIGKMKALKYGNLWKNQALEVEDGKHCPLWEKPDVVVPYLEGFLAEVA